MPNCSFLVCLEVVVLWLETKTKTTTKNSVELEATLAPTEAEVGAVAKADQYETGQAKSYNRYIVHRKMNRDKKVDRIDTVTYPAQRGSSNGVANCILV